ncbi:MAG: tetratricopeptide repeat protein [Saprospiraceae bacterium]|nr:tetratricopeptide repeat protein [Saprospiraceae bacterium]
MKAILFVAVLVSTLRTSLPAQTNFTIGTTYTIPSEVLEQERQVHIYLPASYSTSQQNYPVLYILDGQWHFTNGVAIQQALRVPDRLPEMIVIGIQNANPLRRTLFWEKREKFHRFLEAELNPFLEKNFRVSGDRIIFGWEAGAYFACYALLHEKQLFNAAIVTNGGYADREMLDTFEALSLHHPKHLFVANSIKDIYSIQDTEDLTQTLTDRSPKQLRWHYQTFNDEIHESLPYLALYHGLNFYYHNYNSLVFSSIEAYEESGGMDSLKRYFEERGKRYEFSPEIDNSTKNSLIWLAWKRDNFESFSYFMSEFADVLGTPRYASAYWQNRLAQFYLKHGDLEHAIQYFEQGISKYPDPQRLATMHAGLGMAYQAKGDAVQARLHLQRAVKWAEEQSDSDLAKYQEQLSLLKE